MAVKVGVAGYDRVGRRVADAVAAQPDMVLHAVHDSDPLRRRAAANRGRPVVDALVRLAEDCDIVINCGEDRLEVGAAVVHGPRARRGAGPCFTLLSDPAEVFGSRAVQVPGADVVAFARLVHALAPLGRVVRFFASTFLRAGHAADRATGCVDALEPVFDDPVSAWDMRRAIGPVVADYHVRQARGPYTQSDFHMIKMDLHSPATTADAVAALRRAPRVLTAAARDGFADTAQVQEFYRDMSGGRPNRFAVFLWEESVVIEDGSLMLMADVCQETTPVPEIIDAVRLIRTEMDVAESAALTDAALGVRTRWQEIGARGR
jgi:glyceraldehyde-3-phosphate dehydrogenase (NAD(P))